MRRAPGDESGALPVTVEETRKRFTESVVMPLYH